MCNMLSTIYTCSLSNAHHKYVYIHIYSTTYASSIPQNPSLIPFI